MLIGQFLQFFSLSILMFFVGILGLRWRLLRRHGGISRRSSRNERWSSTVRWRDKRRTISSGNALLNKLIHSINGSQRRGMHVTYLNLIICLPEQYGFSHTPFLCFDMYEFLHKCLLAVSYENTCNYSLCIK